MATVKLHQIGLFLCVESEYFEKFKCIIVCGSSQVTLQEYSLLPAFEA